MIIEIHKVLHTIHKVLGEIARAEYQKAFIYSYRLQRVLFLAYITKYKILLPTNTKETQIILHST